MHQNKWKWIKSDQNRKNPVTQNVLNESKSIKCTKWIIKMNENGSKSPKIVTQMKQIESKSTKKVSTS